MAVDKKLVKAYNMVLDDLSQDLGWKKRIIKKTLEVLTFRLWELENVWATKPTTEVTILKEDNNE